MVFDLKMEDKVMDRDKSVYVFELDDVLYPAQDYVLQVYYLFANFVEYTEGRELAKELLAFMKECYACHGEEQVLSKTLTHFALPEHYLENYERLKANAHLPLKLLLKDEVKANLLSLFEQGKNVGVLTDGNPVEQLNKLKHIDWAELGSYLPSLRVFFIRELKFRGLEPVEFLASTYDVPVAEIQVISR